MKNCKLCVILDRDSLKNRDIEKAARDALRGGADIIQYRDKTSCDKILIREATALRAVVKKYGKILIINDRPDIARVAGADGAHVGQEDMPVRYARRIMGKKIIGASAGNAKEALRAEKNGADYLGIGPVFRSPSKPGKRPIGVKALERIVGKVRVPLFAIGGINVKNIADIKKIGISGVAVISAATGGCDTYALVSALKHELDF